MTGKRQTHVLLLHAGSHSSNNKKKTKKAACTSLLPGHLREGGVDGRGPGGGAGRGGEVGDDGEGLLESGVLAEDLPPVLLLLR